MELGKVPNSVSKRSSARGRSVDGVQNSVEGPADSVQFSGEQPITLLQPQSGKSYRVHEETSRPLVLTFDDRAVAFFQSANLQVDLEQAQILTADGRRVPLDARIPDQADPGQRYAVTEGQKLPADSEPWQFRVPGMPTGVFGKPHGVHLYGGDSGFGLKFLDAGGKPIDRDESPSTRDDFQGMRVETQVFRRNRRATLGQLATQGQPPSPGPAELPFTDNSIPNVAFRAPNQQSLNTVMAGFDKLLGGVAQDRVPKIDLEQLKRFEEKFQERMASELEAGGEVDGFRVMLETLSDPQARAAMQKLHGPGADSLSNQELFSAVGQRLIQASPLEIVVMPADKTALDCVEVQRESTKQQLSRAGRAYFMRSNPFAYRAETGSQGLPPQRLFIGEEILQSDKGVKAVFLHELLHVFEHLYATAEETETIETSFQQATEFQSLYGSSRDEYLTTVGEEFLGTHGSDGPAWVKRHHGPLYDLLSGLTQQTSVEAAVDPPALS